MSMLFAFLGVFISTEVNTHVARMAALYDQVCLNAFPDDDAVAGLMSAQNATELSQEEVKVTMGNDPARAWRLADGTATVWIEFPPFHTCSVRWSASEIGDLQPYHVVAERYMSASLGFRPIETMDADQGSIHIHVVGEDRVLANQSRESLFVIDQHINDPKRRAAGETGVTVRFVHQIMHPLPKVEN